MIVISAVLPGRGINEPGAALVTVRHPVLFRKAQEITCRSMTAWVVGLEVVGQPTIIGSGGAVIGVLNDQFVAVGKPGLQGVHESRPWPFILAALLQHHGVIAVLGSEHLNLRAFGCGDSEVRAVGNSQIGILLAILRMVLQIHARIDFFLVAPRVGGQHQNVLALPVAGRETGCRRHTGGRRRGRGYGGSGARRGGAQ